MKLNLTTNFFILTLASTHAKLRLPTHLQDQINHHKSDIESADRPSIRKGNFSPGKYSCREEMYIMSDDKTVTNTTDDGLTVKTFAPLYGYTEEGFPDYSKYVGQYSSVDTLTPIGIDDQYTCQQSSFIGVNYDGMWFADQVTGFGICISAGPGNAWEGNVGVSGGQGIYEGATGVIRWQCWGNCTLVVDVCVLDAVQQN